MSLRGYRPYILTPVAVTTSPTAVDISPFQGKMGEVLFVNTGVVAVRVSQTQSPGYVTIPADGKPYRFPWETGSIILVTAAGASTMEVCLHLQPGEPLKA